MSASAGFFQYLAGFEAIVLSIRRLRGTFSSATMDLERHAGCSVKASGGYMTERFLIVLGSGLLLVAFQNCSKPGFSEAEQVTDGSSLSTVEDLAIVDDPGSNVEDDVEIPPVIPPPPPRPFSEAGCTSTDRAKLSGSGVQLDLTDRVASMRGGHDVLVKQLLGLGQPGASELGFWAYQQGTLRGASNDYYDIFPRVISPLLLNSKDVCVLVGDELESDVSIPAGTRLPLACVIQENSSVFGKRTTLILKQGHSKLRAILCMHGDAYNQGHITFQGFRQAVSMLDLVPN